jgi:hypothetical protein
MSLQRIDALQTVNETAKTLFGGAYSNSGTRTPWNQMWKGLFNVCLLLFQNN